MTVSERRRAILIALCNRRFERRENLANEFGVGERTMPDKNNTNLAKTPIFTRFLPNSTSPVPQSTNKAAFAKNHRK